MAKVTLQFESLSALPNGPVVCSDEIDEAYAPDLMAALLASEKYGYVIETKTVSVQEGTDADGNPIMVDRPVTTRSPATFEQALVLFYNDAIRDRIVDAVNGFRKKSIEAKKQAGAEAEFKPIEIK